MGGERGLLTEEVLCLCLMTYGLWVEDMARER